jgi:ABC-2 type transport system ATP-binding protein
MAMNAITVEHLTKRYDELVAVDDVSFEVSTGQVVALLGPNGAGKTTTVEILEGFQAASEGTVRVLGVDPRRGDRHWRARIGLVMQSTSLDSQLTVREALALFGGLFADPLPVETVLELIDLRDDANTRIGQLSGGQQRRVDIGLGVIGTPELLFLDEPTTGLDPIARRHVWGTIKNLAAAGGTVLLTTHYMEEAQQLAGRAIVISGGRVVADATPEQLRGQGARSTIRYPLPAHAPVDELPDVLLAGLDPRQAELSLTTDDLTTTLRALIAWTGARDLALDGLEVTRPSLEDAYLSLISNTAQPTPAHAL